MQRTVCTDTTPSMRARMAAWSSEALVHLIEGVREACAEGGTPTPSLARAVAVARAELGRRAAAGEG